MTSAQDEQLAWLLDSVFVRTAGAHEFHHGACDGADLEAATIAAAIEGFRYDVISHPAVRGKELQRDRELVSVVDIMIAAPLTDQEQLRSGTWATVRYTRKAGKPVIMLSRQRLR